MTPDTSSRGVPLLCVVVSLVLVFWLTGVLLLYAQQRQQDAIMMALKIRRQQWQDHLIVLQQRWEMQHKPLYWNIENHLLRMTSSGWPVTKTSAECEDLWRLLLAEDATPLVRDIRVADGGCEYKSSNSAISYNYQRQSIVFSEIHE